MKKLFLLTLLCFPYFLSELIATTIIENHQSLPILTPSFSERKTLKIRLDNGLEAYLISDPNIDKSSAALAVEVGSWDDPPEYSGTAHFLEHMLFLGTKKYPKESEYSQFIAEHDGESNAFTSNQLTAFVFTINNDVFPEALDRFANFFIEPLFNPSGVSRELSAIDQEYAKNVEDDDFRQFYILKELANPQHPFHAFGMGNRSTLTQVSQETLKNWYRQHYSSNLMHLEVISNLPLETLQELVENDFGPIQNNHRNATEIDRLPMFNENVKGQMVYVEPIKHISQLILFWDLPQKFAKMQETKPDELACYVLGHEGKNSLLANLKQEKLAEGLSCGSTKLGKNNIEFYIQIDLTDIGVKKVNDVISKSFQAIADFKKKGVPQYLFDELYKISSVNYQFQPRENAFEHILKEASLISNEPISTYPEHTKVIQKFDPQAVLDLLGQLTPQNAIFLLVAPEELREIKTDRKEPWLGVSYSVKSISPQLLMDWNKLQPDPKISLPEPNPFVVEQHGLQHKIEASVQISPNAPAWLPHPTTILENEKATIFFAQDHLYKEPKINWNVQLRTPAISRRSPASFVLGDLFILAVKDALNSYTYPASIAGLHFDIEREENGISISIDGYSEKADLLYLNILKGLKEFQPDENRFNIFKAALERQYLNGAVDAPFIQALEMLKAALYKNYITNKQKADLIKKVTFDDFSQFIQILFQKIYVQGMLYGNLNETKAKYLSNELLSLFDGQTYPKIELEKKEIKAFSDENGPFVFTGKNKIQGNVAILAIEAAPFSFRARAAQQILMQALKEPFFTALRTQQQTGYIVLSQSEEIEKHLFDLFIVQSNTHTPKDLLNRFEGFINSFLQNFDKNELSEEQFEQIKAALLVSLDQKPKNISEMGELLNRLAFSFNADFDWIAKRIEGFKQLTYKEWIQQVKQTMGSSNKKRIAILLSSSLTSAPQTSEITE